MEFLAGLHPKIVHFPIALLMTYTFLELIGVFLKNDTCSKTAYIILVFGVLGAIAAVMTGNQADTAAEFITYKNKSVPAEAISIHETYANISFWIFAGILIFRTYFLIRKKFTFGKKIFIVLLALTGSYFIFEAGLKGGELVFKYGVGTKIIIPDQNNQLK